MKKFGRIMGIHVCKRTGIDDKRASAHQCRRYRVTTQLAMGRSPLDVQRQMGHRTLAMTNKYASLTIGHLKKSHERHSPLGTDIGGSTEVFCINCFYFSGRRARIWVRSVSIRSRRVSVWSSRFPISLMFCLSS